MADIQLRPARPDLAEGAQFARYLDQAADNTFRAMLGRRSVDIVAEAFVEPGHDLSHEYVTVAESPDGVAGMLSGYSGPQHAASRNEPLLDAAGWRQYRMAAVRLIGARVFDFMDQLPDTDWYVQAVAVDPASRGLGVGSLLLDRAEQIARDCGSERVTLDVAVRNDGARRLYERIGYEVEASSKAVPFAPSAAVHRMVKPL